MTGSGTGGGIDFQAEIFAYIACHAVAQHPLDWFEDSADVPVAISMETGGPGDDISIETAGGQLIEIQCKEGLKKGEDFRTAVDRLIQGLNNNPSLRAALVVSRASQTIQTHLKEGVLRLAGGRDDGLRRVTQELLERQNGLGITDFALFQRFRIIKKDVKEGDDGRTAATVLLRHVVQDPSATATAWSKLVDEGHDLIAHRGRKTVESLLRLLARHVGLASTSNNQLVARERYTRWVAESTQHSMFRASACLSRFPPLGSVFASLMTSVIDARARPVWCGKSRRIMSGSDWQTARRTRMPWKRSTSASSARESP